MTSKKDFNPGEYLGIHASLKGEYSLLLQRYEDAYYLRVEDGSGAGILKCWMDYYGAIVPSYNAPPETEEEFMCIDWAISCIC